MREIVRRATLAVAMSLAVLGGLAFATGNRAPGLPSMTPPAAPFLRDDPGAAPSHRQPAPTPSPRPGYP